MLPRVQIQMQNVYQMEPQFSTWLVCYHLKKTAMSLYSYSFRKPISLDNYDLSAPRNYFYMKSLISEDNELNSALHYAACSGNTNTAKLLLDNRLELDKKNRRESTPLFVACLNNRCAMVEFLIDRGAKFE